MTGICWEFLRYNKKVEKIKGTWEGKELSTLVSFWSILNLRIEDGDTANKIHGYICPFVDNILLIKKSLNKNGKIAFLWVGIYCFWVHICSSPSFKLVHSELLISILKSLIRAYRVFPGILLAYLELLLVTKQIRHLPVHNSLLIIYLQS